MKLPRPYIPLATRILVAERQYKEAGWVVTSEPSRAWLNVMLRRLFGVQKVELHHRPALCNREKYVTGIHGERMLYVPDANDPDYLVYLPDDEHDIETRVRGQHGDYSDLAKARKRKRKERKAKRPKRKWPTRKFPKRAK